MKALDTIQSMFDDMFLQKKPSVDKIINGLVIEFHETGDRILQRKISKYIKDKYNIIFDPFNNGFDPFSPLGLHILNREFTRHYSVVREKMKKIKNKPERWSFYCQFSVVGTCYAMIREA